MTDETPIVSVGWRRAALAYWWLVLSVSVAVSSYGNVMHAGIVAADNWRTVAQWIGGCLPSALLIMVEGIAIGTRGGAAGKARAVAWAMITPLILVVLASSYAGLLSVMVATELFPVTAPATAALTYGLAAVPDMLMVTATVYVMSMRHDKPTAVEVRRPSRWARIADNLGSRVEAATELKQQVDPFVEAPRTSINPSVEPAVEVTAPTMNTSTGAFVEVSQPPTETSTEVRGGSTNTSVGGSTEAVETSTETSTKPSVKPRKPSVKPATKPLDPSVEAHLEAASWMVETEVVARKSATEIAEVIAAISERKSPNRIKAELSVSPSTTAKIAAAHRRWDELAGDLRQLASVG